MLIKMKDLNVINYLNKNNIEIPKNIKISTVDIPSYENKSQRIKQVKEQQKHANMKFTFSNPDYSGLGDKLHGQSLVSLLVTTMVKYILQIYLHQLEKGQLHGLQ